MSGTPVRPASTQEKIHRQKTKEGDTQAGYLQEKLVGSEYVTIVEEDGSVGKRLKIELNMTGIAGGSFEDPFTGSTSKVPYSSAIRKLLRALYITDATDCGSGGNSIMYKTISIPVSNSCICEGEQAGFSDHYPSIFGSFDLLQNNLLTFAERSLGLKLITTETDPSDQGDGYGAVLLEAMIDEDCSDNNTIFLDTVIQTKDNRGVDAQTNLRCFAIGFNEGQATEISTVSDVKILDAAGNGLYKKVSFAIDLGAITASSPFSIKFILFSGSALIAADAGYQSVDEFTLLSARVRYPIKTINLRSADINM